MVQVGDTVKLVGRLPGKDRLIETDVKVTEIIEEDEETITIAVLLEGPNDDWDLSDDEDLVNILVLGKKPAKSQENIH